MGRPRTVRPQLRRDSLGGPLAFMVLRLPISLSLAGIAVVASTACSQVSREQASRNTETYIRIVAGLVTEFMSVRGRYPVSLAELCIYSQRDCSTQRPVDGVNDGWGRPFVYRTLDTGFEIVSLGPDGIVRTPDDQVVNPVQDRVRASKVAGCYRVARGWWPSYSPKVQLDTAPGTVGPFNSTYALDVSAPGGSGQAEWYLVGQDSLILQWVAFREAVSSIRARIYGDTLRGSRGDGEVAVFVRESCRNR